MNGLNTPEESNWLKVMRKGKYTMDSPNEDDLQKHKDYKDHYDFHTQIKRCIKKMEQQEKSSSASATGKE